MTSNTLATTGETATYDTSYSGAVYLTINGTQIMLTAANLSIPRFSYVADSFYEAIKLGSISKGIPLIMAKFSDITGVSSDSLIEKINSFTNLEILKPITTADLVITEFVVQPSTTDKIDGKYSFGFGLSLNKGNKIGPVTLDGVSFTVSFIQKTA